MLRCGPLGYLTLINILCYFSSLDSVLLTKVLSLWPMNWIPHNVGCGRRNKRQREENKQRIKNKNPQSPLGLLPSASPPEASHTYLVSILSVGPHGVRVFSHCHLDSTHILVFISILCFYMCYKPNYTKFS